MIDQATVDRIFDAARIEDVVSDFVSLKKRGVNMIGLCPFHNEKTPSFTVSPAKNFCKCFGCGKGGNPINFIMDLEQLSFPDALRYLANKYNIEIVEKEVSGEQRQIQNDRESMLIVNNYAQALFSQQLYHTEEGKLMGLSYLREREFREDIILKFQLGYCLERRDSFSQQALKEGYKLKYLESTGLTIVREDYQVDRFKGRVMFPIHSIAGKVIGFGGRIIKNDDKTAKYLNSPDSTIYHKGSILYGLYFAKQSIAKLDNCFVVEGYTDVLSMHQAGIENVVASSGTAFTPEQVRLIKRFSSNVTMIFDGDSAGISASKKGIDLVLREGMNVKVLPLPDGEDPDTFFKKMSSVQFNEYLEINRVDFIHFKANALMKEGLKDPIKRANLISDIVRSIAQIPDTIIRSVYIKECNRLLNIDEASLYDQVKRIKREAEEQEQKASERKSEGGVYNSQVNVSTSSFQVPPPVITNYLFDAEEQVLLTLLMRYGKHCNPKSDQDVGTYILESLKQDELHSENPLYQKILDEYASHHEATDFNPESFFTMHRDPAISKLATHLLADAHQVSKMYKQAATSDSEGIIEDLVVKGVLQYKIRYIESSIKETMQDIALADTQNNEQLLIDSMNELQELKLIHAEFMKLLGGRIYSSF